MNTLSQLTSPFSVQLKILDSRLGSKYAIPKYATQKSAGLDLIACHEKKMLLNPGSCELISTGMSIYLDNPNVTAMIMPRSGLGAKQGIVLGNLTGVIDADYQGPLMVPLWNRGEQEFVLEPGMRIAQMIIVPILQAQFQLVENFTTKSERDSGGFGHTGKF